MDDYKRLSTASLVHILKGYSALYRHPPFNLKRRVVVDDLHCLYLGVVLTLLKLWFGKENKGQPFYIGHKVWIMIHLLVFLHALSIFL